MVSARYVLEKYKSAWYLEAIVSFSGEKKQEYFVSHEVFGGMPSSRGLALSWRIIAPVQNLLTTSPTVSPISSQAKAVPVLF
jgi:hypothetical protein